MAAAPGGRATRHLGAALPGSVDAPAEVPGARPLAGDAKLAVWLLQTDDLAWLGTEGARPDGS